tara:strand:+ start:1584 stop:1715 length:132 start_codon:yes stop_codon:yes gene_type:complete
MFVPQYLIVYFSGSIIYQNAEFVNRYFMASGTLRLKKDIYFFK